MQPFEQHHRTISLPRIPAPPMARIRQHFRRDAIDDVTEQVCRQLLTSEAAAKIRKGDRIAITGSSRGMGGFIPLLKGIISAVKQREGEPFILPSMGSHGGAVVEGQIEILHRLGVSKESVGAPIRATMDTVLLGKAENGAEAHLDKYAAEADGIIVFERVKIHPESKGDYASGLLKCITIGLGKQRGAQEAHRHGLWESVRAVPRITMAHAKILCGIAVVENAYDEPVHVEVVPPQYEAFLDADIRLLNKANSYFPKIPFDHLDLLIVDEIGKDVAGSGIDPNVIGTWRISGGPHIPDYRRIVILSLTPASLGNGIGIGFADFTTARFLREFDPMVTYVNVLTATEPDNLPKEGMVPLALPADRDAIEVALYSSLPKGEPRVCRIKNSNKLHDLWVSPAMLEEVRRNASLELIDDPTLLPFNESGNLF